MKTPLSNRCHRLAPWLIIFLIAIPAVCSTLSENRLLVRHLGEGGNSTDDYVENSIAKDSSDGGHPLGDDMKVANNITYNKSESNSDSPNEWLSSGNQLDEIEVNDPTESGGLKVGGNLTSIKGAEKTSAKPPVWPDDDDDDFIAKKTAGSMSLSSAEEENDYKDETPKIDHSTKVNETADELASEDTAHVVGSDEVNSAVDEKVKQDEELSSITTEKSSLNGQKDFSGALKGPDSASEINEGESFASSQNDESTKAPLPESHGDAGDETDSQTFEKDTDNYLSFNQNTGDKESAEDYAPTYTTTFAWEDTDTNPIDIPDTTDSAVNFEPFNEGTPSSEIAYHRNESNQEKDDGATDKKDGVQSELKTETNEEANGKNTAEQDVGSSNEEVADASALFCRPATSCMECINLSIDHLRLNSDPCYWVGQCISAGEASTMKNSPSGAYKCGEDGSPIYTGEEWITALNAIAESSQVPIEKKRGEVPMNTSYFDGYEDEEDGFFENVKFLFNVLLLAACLASGLLIRKRVMNRLRDDPTLETADVVKEEVIAFVSSIANFVKDKISGSGSSPSRDSEYRPIATSTTNESFERQAIPLSTAADEEWGWDDEEPGPSLELGEVGGDDAKEEEDLALAIAMSLSESTNGSSGTTVKPNASRSQPSTHTNSALKPKSPTPFSARLKEKKSPIAAPKPKARIGQQTTSSPPPPPPPAAPPQGDSIEDLLDQMNAGRAPLMTSFGQMPTTTASKPKPAYQKKDSVDDMFASMGLSNSYASKPATSTAPKSAPLPPSKSLAADNDDDLDWGDDGDLDDLLDD
ncbi:hypothetical protein ACHAWO_011060 [Cyclotella atomus]|uniref:Uncharacterized protein n=1 Tax=Cyclotella atomus TaxID=382360 RepID=A0ABD3PZZ7_9STRA